MLTLLSECHFWTTRDEIRIKNSDLGAFKYTKSRDFDEKNVVAVGKKEYCEKRDGKATLKNQKKSRLKDNVKKMEELLKCHKIVHSYWEDAAVAQVFFSNGVLLHICVDTHTGDILKMAYDKFFVGKLAADVITDAVFTRHYIVLAYNTNQITVVYLQKPNLRRSGPEKISNMDPRIYHALIPGPAERKLPRHLAISHSLDLIVVWTKSSQNEVYPWRPTIRDQDRANIHIFKLKSAKIETLGYCWTENDPLTVEFLRTSENQILTIEQKVSRKGEITAEICSYEFSHSKVQRSALSSIPLGTQICCHRFSPDQEKLFLGTIDRFVYVHDLVRQTTKFAPQIDIIPTQCAWHPDSSLIIVANDRSQFQCFDIALSSVANQLLSEDVTPSNLLDLSHYFAIQPTLLNLAFSGKPDLGVYTESFAQTDCFLLLMFENGPLGCLRFFAGAGMTGDIHNSGLTPDVVINKYLLLNQFDKAVNLFTAINWETYGAMCLISLHKISNFLFTKTDLRKSRIELLSKALKTFGEDLSEDTKDEFGDQVFDLRRRFFFYLLRNKLYPDAFEIAQGIEDYDLLMDLFNITKGYSNLQEIAQAAYKQAELVLNETDNSNSKVGDVNSVSSCSFSSCSNCTSPAKSSDTTQHRNGNQHEDNQLKNYVPPLPSFKSPVFNAENIKINIPKPELRMEGFRSYTRQSKPLPPLPRNVPRPRPNRSAINTMNPSPWMQQIPDQTIGIPTVSPAYHHTYVAPLPRVFIPNEPSSLIYQPVPQHQFAPKFYQHPLISGTIPPTATIIAHDDMARNKRPAASILSNSTASVQLNGGGGGAVGGNMNSTNALNNNNPPLGKKDPGEKNKVKFSDTVQVAVVPEIPRKEKPLPPKRNGYNRPRNMTNPQKELADSLPLCHPHDDYLKDFNPVSDSPSKSSSSTSNRDESSEPSNSKNSPSIKVVHFGVV